MNGLRIVAGSLLIGAAVFAAVHLGRELRRGRTYMMVNGLGRRSFERSESPFLFWLTLLHQSLLALILAGSGTILAVLP